MTYGPIIFVTPEIKEVDRLNDLQDLRFPCSNKEFQNSNHNF